MSSLGQILQTWCILLMGKVHFWPSNSCLSLILAIQLQNRVALTIQLSKPVTFGHPSGFECGFADVDATWLWSPPVSPPLPLLSLSSLLSPFSLFLLSSPSPSPSPVLCRGRGRRHRWPAMPDGQATPRTTPRPACARHRPVPSPQPRLGHARALPARRTRPCRPPRRALRPSPRALPYPALPSLASRRRLPLPSSLPEPSRAPLGAQNGAAAR